jgi:hypothetical protein
MAFDESTPRANILALSKRGDDASKLLERLRRIHVLLPPFLRQPEDATTRGSKREFRIQDRAAPDVGGDRPGADHRHRQRG